MSACLGASFFLKANTSYIFILIQNCCVFSFIEKYKGVIRYGVLGCKMQMFCFSEWGGECFNSKINLLYFDPSLFKATFVMLFGCLQPQNFFFLNNIYQKYNDNQYSPRMGIFILMSRR